MLGSATLRLTLLPFVDTEGVILRAEAEGNASDLSLVCVYGGANGQGDRRGGDIGYTFGTVNKYFQLKPEYCASSVFAVDGANFTMTSKAATFAGLSPVGSKSRIADATKWASLADLLGSSSDSAPGMAVGVNEAALQTGKPIVFALQRPTSRAAKFNAADLPQIFAATEKHRHEIAERIVVDTPDPFINAAASALCVATDAVWDASAKAFMHGAVAWRVRLLGWRGPYSGDELGWHDRTRQHLIGCLTDRLCLR